LWHGADLAAWRVGRADAGVAVSLTGLLPAPARHRPCAMACGSVGRWRMRRVVQSRR
jgi:hypothetical protein